MQSKKCDPESKQLEIEIIHHLLPGFTKKELDSETRKKIVKNVSFDHSSLLTKQKILFLKCLHGFNLPRKAWVQKPG